ncbi:hypothetical protein [Chromohalobacter israelensis]|uniref:hypothetical protein n=1 Tax=Chromohalobacter israelensis TaxID=141390 RepID=UPI00265BA5E6|nr:hypothetical protein [Chromohalobacter salexigens]MDO0946641.1 hypothetical protein [Chromohalobacter salexigens]
MTENATELERLAAQAESEERASEEAEQAAEAEWEDVDAHREQAAALAKMGVQGVEFLAGMIHPGHALDDNARAQGEASLLPVAMDFAGEVPEWLRPYLHYLGAGMWMGGVLFAAYKERRAEDAERERKEAEQAEQGAAHGG